MQKPIPQSLPHKKTYAHLKTLLIIGALLELQGCGTMQSKLDKVNIGDPIEKVEDIMGSPDDSLKKDNQEAYRYCVSGAGFGWNAHHDIIFLDGKVNKTYSYKSTVTGCTNGFEAVRWVSAGNYFSLDAAQAYCTQLGFKPNTDGMANCLMIQLQQKNEY